MQLGPTMPGTLPVCEPLVTAPENLRKGSSRENDEADAYNNPRQYPPCPGRVKTRRPYRSRSTLRSSQTGSTVSRTTPSDPNTR